jgi:fructokinase
MDAIGLGAPTLSNHITTSFLDDALTHLSEGCVVGIDLNYRPTMWTSIDEYVRTMEVWLPKANLIKCNEKEGQLITGNIGDPKSILDAMNLREDQIAFLTLGEKGCMIRYGSNIWDLPSNPIAGQPIGAGDSYFSAILVGFVSARKKAPHENLLDQLPLIGHYANICGGIANVH